MKTCKITVHLPPELLDHAMKKTGGNVTETMRDGLKQMAYKRAYECMLALRGKVRFKYTAAELRGDE